MDPQYFKEDTKLPEIGDRINQDTVYRTAREPIILEILELLALPSSELAVLLTSSHSFAREAARLAFLVKENLRK